MKASSTCVWQPHAEPPQRVGDLHLGRFHAAGLAMLGVRDGAAWPQRQWRAVLPRREAPAPYARPRPLPHGRLWSVNPAARLTCSMWRSTGRPAVPAKSRAKARSAFCGTLPSRARTGVDGTVSVDGTTVTRSAAPHRRRFARRLPDREGPALRAISQRRLPAGTPDRPHQPSTVEADVPPTTMLAGSPAAVVRRRRQRVCARSSARSVSSATVAKPTRVSLTP